MQQVRPVLRISVSKGGRPHGPHTTLVTEQTSTTHTHCLSRATPQLSLPLQGLALTHTPSRSRCLYSSSRLFTHLSALGASPGPHSFPFSLLLRGSR
jgi:hypothetical protein